MTKAEFRQTKGYKEAKEKIENYPKDFKFNLNYASIPKAKGNALKIIVDDCVKERILECIEIGLDLQGNITDKTYRRL